MAKKPKDAGARAMTEAEVAEMTAPENNAPPEGYANTKIEEPSAAPASPETPPAAAAPETPPAPPAPPAAPAAGVPEDTFTKLERELVKEEGKEDLSTFSAREKAYFHQMRRDRKGRQSAETERDVVIRENLRLKNPPPPPPDPLEGLGEDEVLSVKEIRERLAKLPPATAPAAPAVSPAAAQARHYLVMCEKEARAAHPDDFDAVMDLTELIDNDPTIMKDISARTAKGENPAEVMYSEIKKHKDFESLLPAAQTRVLARKPAAPAAPPASPAAPAAPATPEDKAKTERAIAAQDALNKNGQQPRTTAHVSAREGKPAEEMTLEEITAMPDLEFAKLPRHVRQRYLKQHGA